MRFTPMVDMCELAAGAALPWDDELLRMIGPPRVGGPPLPGGPALPREDEDGILGGIRKRTES